MACELGPHQVDQVLGAGARAAAARRRCPSPAWRRAAWAATSAATSRKPTASSPSDAASRAGASPMASASAAAATARGHGTPSCSASATRRGAASRAAPTRTASLRATTSRVAVPEPSLVRGRGEGHLRGPSRAARRGGHPGLGRRPLERGRTSSTAPPPRRRRGRGPRHSALPVWARTTASSARARAGRPNQYRLSWLCRSTASATSGGALQRTRPWWARIRPSKREGRARKAGSWVRSRPPRIAR